MNRAASRTRPRTTRRGGNSRSRASIFGLFLALLFVGVGGPLHAQKRGSEPSQSGPDVTQLSQSAEDALRRKDFKAAAEHLEALLKSQPDSVPGWFNLAYAYTALGRKDEAVAAYQKTLALKPDLYQAQLNLGILLLEMKRPSEAAVHLQKATDLEPDKSRAHLYLARSLVQDGKAEDAGKQFQEALRLDPASAMGHFDLGQLYLSEKKFDAAQASFAKAAELDPRLPQAELGLALAAEGLKAPAEAAKHFEAYLAGQPGDAETKFHLARIYLELGKNDQALATLQAVYEVAPDLKGLAAALGDVNTLLGKFPESEKYYRQALQASPETCDLHRALGRTLLEEKKFAEAEKEFRAALKIDGRNREAIKGLASSLYLQKRYADAIPVYEFLAKQPDSAGVFFLLATCYDHLRLKPQALENYQHYLELSHGQNPDQEWQAQQRTKLIQDELKR